MSTMETQNEIIKPFGIQTNEIEDFVEEVESDGEDQEPDIELSEADEAPTEEELKQLKEASERIRNKFIYLADIKRFAEHIREIGKWLQVNGYPQIPTDEDLAKLKVQSLKLAQQFVEISNIKKYAPKNE